MNKIEILYRCGDHQVRNWLTPEMAANLTEGSIIDFGHDSAFPSDQYKIAKRRISFNHSFNSIETIEVFLNPDNSYFKP